MTFIQNVHTWCRGGRASRTRVSSGCRCRLISGKERSIDCCWAKPRPQPLNATVNFELVRHSFRLSRQQTLEMSVELKESEVPEGKTVRDPRSRETVNDSRRFRRRRGKKTWAAGDFCGQVRHEPG